ncbi:hypothetical protein [Eggerthella sinensis]|uniref:hypothetical protein n=1 Tax=Eggerthella sinensis TaxID=242230 RepID=UPI0022E840C9|nr:hypothetical protein [Eggerthella sinensis]
MKKLIACMVALALPVVLLASCVSGATQKVEPENTQPATEQTPVSTPEDLQLIETGYTVNDGGYVQLAVGVRNPNEDFEAQRYSLRITGKDEAGKIVFADDQVMNFLLPGGEDWFACTAGNGTAPATVEFALSIKDNNWIKNDHVAEAAYIIDNVSEIVGDFAQVSYTGEITASKEWSDVGSAWVSAILRDDAGAIVGGYYTYVDVSKQGETVPFEITTYDVPEHSSFEVNALPWW